MYNKHFIENVPSEISIKILKLIFTYTLKYKFILMQWCEITVIQARTKNGKLI